MEEASTPFSPTTRWHFCFILETCRPAREEIPDRSASGVNSLARPILTEKTGRRQSLHESTSLHVRSAAALSKLLFLNEQLIISEDTIETNKYIK